MKKVILLTLLMPFPAFSQVVLDFESGDVSYWVQSAEDHWDVDSLTSISGNFSLHHSFDNPNPGTDQIGIPITNLHPSQGLTKWSFLLKHGYDPSSSNNWAVFIISESEPSAMLPDGGSNGFAVGVNFTGYDDTLRLWKIKSGNITTVVNSHINWQETIGSSDAVKIIVERSIEGIWDVSVYSLSEELIGTASGYDNDLFNTEWFGIFFKYSSTRDRLLWLDDLSIDGIFYEDIEPPSVTACNASGINSVEFTLNEPTPEELLVPANFSLNVSGNRSVSVKKINSLTYRVEFESILKNKVINSLIISSLCDNYGNCDTDIHIEFTPVWAEVGDVIISEIMADPLPEVSLPGKEYLEITNRTEFQFNLKNWIISSQDQDFKIPETIIQPMEIRIICLSKDTSLFKTFGKVTGLKQFPSLTDGGKMLCLSDSSGRLVHGVEYSSDWYRDELKSRGGWSLEMMDTRYPFYGDENWTVSTSRRGGTPGSVNSVSCTNLDISFFGIRNVFPIDSLNVTVRFSEPVFNLPENIKSIGIEDHEIIALNHVDPLYREFNIELEEPIIRRQLYELNISGDLNDFTGNEVQNRTFVFGLPEPSGPGDILFNELLFNPFPGDPDYLELYNCSEKIIDLSRLQLVSVNDEVGDTSQLYQVSDEERCIMPASYYAITPDMIKIYHRYFSTNPECLFETGSLPAMPDSEGHLVLFNRELDKIDEVFYSDDMHYSLLSGCEGIALEKIAPNNKSVDLTSWHSASESAGWGTPGAPNSMFLEVQQSDDKVVFSSSKISPDNDGNEDILTIGFTLSGNSSVVSIQIFDEIGTYIKKVAANMLIGPEASLIWDGTADDGSPVNTGIYVVLISLFDETGKTERWKKVCTVLR